MDLSFGSKERCRIGFFGLTQPEPRGSDRVSMAVLKLHSSTNRSFNMTIENTNERSATSIPDGDAPHQHDKHKGPHRARRYGAAVIACVALLGFGAVAGAGAISMMRPSVEMAPMTPVAISSMPDWGLVTVKGKVVEVFGNKFVVEDPSGRALIETGPSGEGGKLVALDEIVSVQGRFENGFIHATYLTRADGKTETLGPAGGPPHGKGPGWMRHIAG
jgi:hypothetical protein